MALTYIIFRRFRSDVLSSSWVYTYMRSVRWSGDLDVLRAAVRRTDPQAIAVTPDVANLLMPNVGEWK